MHERPDNYLFFVLELEVVPSGVRDLISYIHLDPTGQHILISTATGADVFYCNRGQTKLKNLAKLKV